MNEPGSLFGFRSDEFISHNACFTGSKCPYFSNISRNCIFVDSYVWRRCLPTSDIVPCPEQQKQICYPHYHRIWSMTSDPEVTSNFLKYGLFSLPVLNPFLEGNTFNVISKFATFYSNFMPAARFRWISVPMPNQSGLSLSVFTYLKFQLFSLFQGSISVIKITHMFICILVWKRALNFNILRQIDRGCGRSKLALENSLGRRGPLWRRETDLLPTTQASLYRPYSLDRTRQAVLISLFPLENFLRPSKFTRVWYLNFVYMFQLLDAAYIS